MARIPTYERLRDLPTVPLPRAEAGESGRTAAVPFQALSTLARTALDRLRAADRAADILARTAEAEKRTAPEDDGDRAEPASDVASDILAQTEDEETRAGLEPRLAEIDERRTTEAVAAQAVAAIGRRRQAVASRLSALRGEMAAGRLSLDEARGLLAADRPLAEAALGPGDLAGWDAAEAELVHGAAAALVEADPEGVHHGRVRLPDGLDEGQRAALRQRAQLAAEEAGRSRALVEFDAGQRREVEAAARARDQRAAAGADAVEAWMRSGRVPLEPPDGAAIDRHFDRWWQQQLADGGADGAAERALAYVDRAGRAPATLVAWALAGTASAEVATPEALHVAATLALHPARPLAVLPGHGLARLLLADRFARGGTPAPVTVAAAERLAPDPEGPGGRALSAARAAEAAEPVHGAAARDWLETRLGGPVSADAFADFARRYRQAFGLAGDAAAALELAHAGWRRRWAASAFLEADGPAALAPEALHARWGDARDGRWLARHLAATLRAAGHESDPADVAAVVDAGTAEGLGYALRPRGGGPELAADDGTPLRWRPGLSPNRRPRDDLEQETKP